MMTMMMMMMIYWIQGVSRKKRPKVFST